ncbi:MAG: hypothetical protein Q9170_006441 [Blastenia crenularia]
MTTPRRVLQDLPVNTFGTPNATDIAPTSNVHLKRHIAEVDEPASPPFPSRFRVTNQTESAKLLPPRPGPASGMNFKSPSEREGMMEESTQDTNNDTLSTVMDSDIEGDTMNTQQTAATELSQATEQELQLQPLSHAERLRLRLRIALFKVQTNQTNIPMSQLLMPSRKSLGHDISSSSSPAEQRPFQPTLLPAPILKPANQPIQTVKEAQMLSSPPASSTGSPVKLPTPQIFRTPALPQRRTQPLQQTSSPPDSQDGERHSEDSRLTSSAVKGHAAISLLDLRENRLGKDLQCVRNCNSKNPDDIERFSQPVIQTRFLPKDAPLIYGGYERVGSQDGTEIDGDDRLDRILSAQEEGSPVVKSMIPVTDDRIPLVGWRVFLLAMPACCDIAGTTLMNVGLLFVAASIYQMTRGALILFVGLFSVIFLHRKIFLYQWSALFIVVLGVAIVGLAGAIAPNPQAQPDPRTVTETSILFIRDASQQVKAAAVSTSALKTILGVLMIAGAQVFTATQFVLEEWILENYALEPLKVVGWEGVFGFLVTLVGMIILHFAVGQTDAGRNGYFDMREGWREITHYRVIAVTSVLIMISIGGFNFFGLSITRSVSATARSIIDTCRTLFIWIVSLGLGWETFKWLQIVGFALLVYGTFLFNDIVRPPLRACVPRRKPEPLLEEAPIEHM